MLALPAGAADASAHGGWCRRRFGVVLLLGLLVGGCGSEGPDQAAPPPAATTTETPAVEVPDEAPDMTPPSVEPEPTGPAPANVEEEEVGAVPEPVVVEDPIDAGLPDTQAPPPVEPAGRDQPPPRPAPAPAPPLTGNGDSADDRAASVSRMPAYPWPPEDPSSLVRLDQLHDFRHGASASLFDVSEVLGGALQAAGYLERSYFRAPGGFVLVTRLEGIDADGAPLDETRRYRPPSDDADFSFADYIRHLFFAPAGYYRFIAFVVSDQPYRTGDAALDEATALDRLRRGAVALPDRYRRMPFSADHRVDALIYEFRKAGQDVETLRPGRLPPSAHLERSGLMPALRRGG